MNVGFARSKARSAVLTLIRTITVISSGDNAAINGFRKTFGPPPRLVPFEISESEGKKRLENWHTSHWLAPSRLLNQPDVAIRSAYLPFWCFDCSLTVNYTTKPGEKTQNGEISLGQELSGSFPLQEFSSALPFMQVYASFKYRRDLAESLKLTEVCGMLGGVFEWKNGMGLKSVGGVEVDGVTMKQGMAWELALRALKLNQVENRIPTINLVQTNYANHSREEIDPLCWNKKAAVESLVKSQTGAALCQETLITIQTHRRSAQLLYYPAYILQYNFSESHSSKGEIVPDRYEAMVSGCRTGAVSAERHFCPRKSQLVAGGVGGSVVFAASAVSDAASGFETLMSAGLVDTCFFTFLAATSAGVMARFGTKARRWQHSQKLEEAEAEFLKKYEQQSEAGRSGPFDAYQDWIRCDSEWRHWEESGKWQWQEDRRRSWGEAVWKNQHVRRRENEALKLRLEEERIQRERDEKREAKRYKRWGASHFDRFHQSKKNVWRGAGMKRDSKGYYRILGLETSGEINEEDVKVAFRKLVMKYHPDRQKVNGNSGEVAEDATLKFQQLQAAYEVLKDPKLRRKYDRGELIDC